MINKFDKFFEDRSSFVKNIGRPPKFKQYRYEDLLVKNESLKHKQDIIDLISGLDDSGHGIFEYSEGFFVSGKKFKEIIDQDGIEDAGGLKSFLNQISPEKFVLTECLIVDLKLDDEDDDFEDDNPEYNGDDDADKHETFLSKNDFQSEIESIEVEMKEIEKEFKEKKNYHESQIQLRKIFQRIVSLDSNIGIFRDRVDDFLAIVFN